MYEVALDARGFGPVAGVDEAGRGACAGPIVIAACILPRRTIPSSRPDRLEGLSPAARERLFPLILRFDGTSTVIVPRGRRALGIQQRTFRDAAGVESCRWRGYVLTDAMRSPAPAPHLPMIGERRGGEIIAARVSSPK